MKNTLPKFFTVILFFALVACSVSTPTIPIAQVLPTLPPLSSSTANVLPAIEYTATATSTATAKTVKVVSPTLTAEEPTNLPSATATSKPIVQTVNVPSGGSYQVHFVDVGQGDSELIITPNKNVVLIDGGEQNTGIVSYLKSVGVTQIDVMVATHPHSDHIGGLVDIFKSGMSVKKVITNGRAANSGIFNSFLDGIANAKAEYVEAQRGDKFVVDGMEFDVVSPHCVLHIG